MRTSTYFTLFAAFLLVAGSRAWSAQRHGQHQRHHHQTVAPSYDPAKEVTKKGTVEAVEVVSAEDCPGCPRGVHLQVKMNGESHDVHLGPAAFLSEKGFRFEPGDAIEVTGCQVEYEGSQAILAREVRSGDETLTLRDSQGRPLWRRGT